MLTFLTTLLASGLPNFLLNGFTAYLRATTSEVVEREKTRRQTITAALSSVVQLRQVQAAVTQTAMSHKMFWIPWTIAASAAAVWYAWGMADSAWPGHLPHVASLPPQLLAFTQQIWNNLFLSGGIAVGGTAVASAIRSAVKK